MTPEYKTADEWRASLGNNATVPVELKILTDILAQLEQLNGGGGGGGIARQLYFVTAAGQNDYTAADVPTLANMVGKSVTLVTLAGGVIDPSLYSWDGTTFSFDPAITINGNEFVVIFFQ